MASITTVRADRDTAGAAFATALGGLVTAFVEAAAHDRAIANVNTLGVTAGDVQGPQPGARARHLEEAIRLLADPRWPVAVPDVPALVRARAAEIAATIDGIDE